MDRHRDDRDDRDEFGWSEPRHWRAGWLGIYVNRDDPRLLVPKRRPMMGWTLNMGNPKARLVLAAGAAVLAAVAVLARFWES